ncbi:hypothetical protein ABT297_04215 [Dactylosporangium sp. NPDC000555]|uniref:hypothetical protein n=1 Tax=Dactylosporangium sp. NPDC000555 TaxID=3154260 RepID=UPI003330D705
MSSHWDAVGVAFILTTLSIVALVAVDRGYSRAAGRQLGRFQRQLADERRAYWRLHARYTALCSAGVTVDQAAAQAKAEDDPAVTSPIPYQVVPVPHTTVFTTGPLLDNPTRVHGEFGQVVRDRFGPGAAPVDATPGGAA